MIHFDIVIPETAMMSMTPMELLETYVVSHPMLAGINQDRLNGLCEVSVNITQDELELMTTYAIRAIYDDPAAEMLRKLML